MEAQPIRTVILDFDGTCTDVEQEAVGFLEGYKRDLARTVGEEHVTSGWDATEAEVLAQPARHGMVIGGHLVAPPVDPYLLATAVGTLLAPDLDDAETERLFKENYRFTTTAFKPEAREVVSALATADVAFYVVTNSDPVTVGRKLDELAPDGREAIRLHGNARKFLVSPPTEYADCARFATVPELLSVPNWARPIHPRRGHYHDALRAIWDATDTAPEETLVVGDVYELDLVLPALLGCRVHLASGPRTLDYERTGVEQFGGSHAEDLRAVLTLLS